MSVNRQSTHPDAVNELDNIQDGIFYLTGKSNVSISQLITDKFIVENTDFDTLDNFLKAAGIKSENDLESSAFNNFVKTHTRFADWEEMLIQSSNQYTMQHLDE